MYSLLALNRIGLKKFGMVVVLWTIPHQEPYLSTETAWKILLAGITYSHYTPIRVDVISLSSHYPQIFAKNGPQNWNRHAFNSGLHFCQVWRWKIDTRTRIGEYVVKKLILSLFHNWLETPSLYKASVVSTSGSWFWYCLPN
jgi:hypothetical protein